MEARIPRANAWIRTMQVRIAAGNACIRTMQGRIAAGNACIRTCKIEMPFDQWGAAVCFRGDAKKLIVDLHEARSMAVTIDVQKSTWRKVEKAEGFMLGERVVINLTSGKRFQRAFKHGLAWPLSLCRHDLVGDAFLVCVDETLVTKVVQMMQMAPSRCSTSNSINSR